MDNVLFIIVFFQKVIKVIISVQIYFNVVKCEFGCDGYFYFVFGLIYVGIEIY